MDKSSNIVCLLFQPDPSVVTFKPLSQQEYSIIKYTANGYIPCNG